MILLLTLLSIPLPLGYMNLGDVGVFLAACLLMSGRIDLPIRRGALYAGLAAAAGGALADVLLGFAAYAPATFVIKGLMGLGCAWLLRLFPGKQRIFAMLAVAPLVPLGYLCFEYFLYGPTAMLNVWANALQVLVGAGLAYVSAIALKV